MTGSGRQVEFRPELTSIEMASLGPIDEHRVKILFPRSVYRIECYLDKPFENEIDKGNGLWERYATDAGHTLGRSGTSVSVVHRKNRRRIR